MRCSTSAERARSLPCVEAALRAVSGSPCSIAATAQTHCPLVSSTCAATCGRCSLYGPRAGRIRCGVPVHAFRPEDVRHYATFAGPAVSTYSSRAPRCEALPVAADHRGHTARRSFPGITRSARSSASARCSKPHGTARCPSRSSVEPHLPRLPSTVIDGHHLAWRLLRNKPVPVHDGGESVWT